MPILRFFFGHGWWILWHVCFYLVLLISVVMILAIFGQELKRSGETPDTPSPGSFMVFMIGVGLAFVTLVDASIFAAKLQTAWYWRAARIVGLPLIVCVASFPLNMALATRQNYSMFSANVLVSASVILGNLWLLWAANGPK
jgi:uncharacterized membrane protein